MDDYTRQVLLAGLAARLRELKAEHDIEVGRLIELRDSIMQNGATLDLPAPAPRPVPAHAKHRHVSPRRWGRYVSNAEKVRGLLTLQPQSTTTLRQAVHLAPKEWHETLKLVCAMPLVVSQGRTSRMTLRLKEDVE